MIVVRLNHSKPHSNQPPSRIKDADSTILRSKSDRSVTLEKLHRVINFSYRGRLFKESEMKKKRQSHISHTEKISAGKDELK